MVEFKVKVAGEITDESRFNRTVKDLSDLMSDALCYLKQACHGKKIELKLHQLCVSFPHPFLTFQLNEQFYVLYLYFERLMVLSIKDNNAIPLDKIKENSDPFMINSSDMHEFFECLADDVIWGKTTTTKYRNSQFDS